MADELDLQRDLAKAAISADGFGVKISHRFIVGVADLFIQLPGYVGVWIEVKHEKTGRKDGYVSVHLTALQRKFIKDVQTAGGRAGWVVIVDCNKPGNYAIVAGTDSAAKLIKLGHSSQNFRERGGPWPIKWIVSMTSSPTLPCALSAR